MKNIVCLTALLVFFAFPSFAKSGTPINDEMTDKYFANCVDGVKKEGTMSVEGGNKYCACTAMNMQKSMSQEDITALSGTGTPQRTALNKMLLDVNGPCMQYPVHDMLFNQCLKDVKNDAICTCLATKMGDFMADISKRMMPELLEDNPNLFDPMTPILESPEFQQRQQQIALSCATNPNEK